MRVLAFAFAAAGGFLAVADLAAAGGPTLIASAAHCKPTELGCDCADYAAWPGYWEHAPGRDARLAHIVARLQIGAHAWKGAVAAAPRASLPVGPAPAAAQQAFIDETPDGVCASGAVENGVCMPTAQPVKSARSVAAPASLPTGDVEAASPAAAPASAEASAAAASPAVGGGAASSWGGSSASASKGGGGSDGGAGGGSAGGSGGGSGGGTGGNGNAGSGW